MNLKRGMSLRDAGRISRLAGELGWIVGERFFDDQTAEAVFERRLIVGIIFYD